jgi:dsRNA-specific ribonuclease
VKRVVEAMMPMACRQDVNYERLEILGDAFLKYAATLYVFNAFPKAHEGCLPSPFTSFTLTEHFLAAIVLQDEW